MELENEGLNAENIQEIRNQRLGFPNVTNQSWQLRIKKHVHRIKDLSLVPELFSC